MNPFTLNGRKAGGTGFGTISTKPSTGATGTLLSTSSKGGASLLSGGPGSQTGVGMLQVPVGTGSALSSINGDKTP
jgi:hypothetical protein